MSLGKRKTSIFGSVKTVVSTSAEVFESSVSIINNELSNTLRMNVLENELEYQGELAIYEDTIIENIKSIQAEILATTDEVVKRVLSRRLERLEALIK